MHVKGISCDCFLYVSVHHQSASTSLILHLPYMVANMCVLEAGHVIRWLQLTQTRTSARETLLRRATLTRWAWPGEKGASHMCRSSCVRLTPSNRFATTRGSREYSGRILMSAGLAETWGAWHTA